MKIGTKYEINSTLRARTVKHKVDPATLCECIITRRDI